MNTDSISDTTIPVTCSFRTSTTFPLYWKKLINLGYAVDLINHDIESQLQKVQSLSAFEYGRICGIIDTISSFHTTDDILYDFTDTLYLLDILIRQNILPFLELGNKQFMIQENMMSYISSDQLMNSDEYFKNLLSVLPSFLHACVNRYGEDAVSSWRFEVSYPYTFFSEREEFTFRKYLVYFRKIASLIHHILPSAQIGGPGFNDWDNDDSAAVIQSMLRAFRTNHVTPDFITAYNYSMKHDDTQKTYITEDPETFHKRLSVFSSLVHESYPRMDIWITEFNSNLSSRTYINDMSYQAVFLAKSLTDILSSNISAMGYYLLSDLPLRYDDTYDFLFGGWGLFSDTRIAKPSFHIYTMMQTLGHYLLKNGKEYIITANSAGSYQLFFFQYDHFRPEVLDRNIAKEELKKPEDIFFLHPDKHYQVRLKDVPPGIYFIKKFTVSISDGNVFHEWEKVQYLNWNRQYEYDDFAYLSAMRPEIQVITVLPGHPVTLSVTTSSLSAHLYLIEWHSKGENA